MWSIAYQNKHGPIPLQISHEWGTYTEIHAYLSSLCSYQMCDFMIIQDDLIPEHTVCLTDRVLLPPSSQHELLQLPAPQNLLSAAILLWLHKGCCYLTEWEAWSAFTSSTDISGKSCSCQHRERWTHLAPAHVQGTCLQSCSLTATSDRLPGGTLVGSGKEKSLSLCTGFMDQEPGQTIAMEWRYKYRDINGRALLRSLKCCGVSDWPLCPGPGVGAAPASGMV